jgi:3-deoxy-7-phosphoheptulonate synthase
MPRNLQQARQQLDDIDQRLIDALAERQHVIDDIAELKSDGSHPTRDPEREQEVVDRLQHRAEDAGLSPSLVTALYEQIFDHSVRRQERRIEEGRQPEGEEKREAASGPVPLDTKTDRPYRLAARDHHPEDTVIRVGSAAIGGPAPVLIAGPCSVETQEQTFACAETVQRAGGHLLRGGCFKPRTSPHSFQGLGHEGLDVLVEAGRAHDLPIITEVLKPQDVPVVARRADVLQIGARNMQNFSLLKAVGRADRPVMLKRGLTATLDEWLGAAEYILHHGNPEVLLCERGIRTFGEATRFTLDVSSVPVLKERTHLPVVVDPSHASGERRWVPALAKAALAAGADGLMVETHPKPEEALSDGPQALTFETLHDLAAPFRMERAEAA